MGKGLKQLVLGDPRTIAGTVYGTIIVLAVIAAGAKPYEHHLWRLVVLAGVSAVVLWLAHVYSHGLGESLRIGRRMTIGELTVIARPRVLDRGCCDPPAGWRSLWAQRDWWGERASVWLAFGIGVATLTAQGVRYAQLENLGTAATLLTVSLNVALLASGSWPSRC